MPFPTGPLLITAKAMRDRKTGAEKPPAPCWTCGEPCEPGSRIYWHKGGHKAANGQFLSPVWHEHCAAPSVYVKPGQGAQAPAVAVSSDTQDSEAPADAGETADSPMTATATVPAAPVAHANGASGADALGVLAAALQARMGPAALDKAAVEAIAKGVAEGVYKAGADRLNAQLSGKMADALKGSLTLIEAELQARVGAAKADADAGAYAGTCRAIEEAKARGEGAAVAALPEPVTVPALDTLYEADTTAGRMVRLCLATGRHAVLSGPSGSGKTFPVRMECARAGRPLIEVSCADGMGLSHFLGAMTLERHPQGGTVTAWRDGALVRAMRAGAVLLLDECDQLTPQVSTTFYRVLEPGHVPSLLVTDTGETVTAREGFMVFCTGNTVRDSEGRYPGARPSPALLNRLAAIPADYLPDSAELAIFQRAGAGPGEARALRAGLMALRELYFGCALTSAPSTRVGVQVSRVMRGLLPCGGTPNGVNVPMGVRDAWTLYMLGSLPESEARAAEMALSAAYASVGESWS